MECNKEEAERAKQIAETKMQNGDFAGAQKMVHKAQKLFPNLENISQLLTVCVVHCSAQNKIMGVEMDWYGILQIDKSADEATIKKQYRKLALLLHPDKNKFSGAETAFKLIGEANRVLSDKMQRSLYDVKCRAIIRPSAPKPQTQPSQRNYFSKKQSVNVTKPENPNSVTFWTCCSFCKTRYQYYTALLNKVLQCQQCRQTFTAYDLGTKGMPPRFPGDQVPNQNGFPNPMATQNKGGNPMAQNGVSNPGLSKASSQNNNGNLSGSRVPSGGGLKTAKKGVDSEMNVKPNVFSGKDDDKKVEPDLANRKMCGGTSKTSTNDNKKRKRKVKDESSDEEDDMETEEDGRNIGGECRRSSRQKRNVSYKEDLRDDDDFVSPPTRESKEEVKEEGVSKDKLFGFVGGNQRDSDKKGLNQKTNACSEEPLTDKKNRTQECKGMGKEEDIPDQNGRKSEDNNDGQQDSDSVVNPEVLEYPDPEFSDFDKYRAEDCFAVNQVWAIYDTCDGMPRFYARIKKVFTPGFKLRITWLEPDPDDESETKWCDADLSIACGKYMNGGSELTVDHLMFSHQIVCTSGSRKGSILVYPRKGETWAIYKDWDMEWSSEPEKHKPPYQYDFVEILTDFSEDDGIEVTYLGKVKGFVSLFQRTACNGISRRQVCPSEMYRFSHRIPSFRMTGEEREGVPVGSFELDPACLPNNIIEVCGPSDTKKEKETVDSEANVSCGKSPKGKVKGVTGLKKNGTPKKNDCDIKQENVILRRSPRKVNSETGNENHAYNTTNGSQNQHKGNPTDAKPKSHKKNMKDDCTEDSSKHGRSRKEVSH